MRACGREKVMTAAHRRKFSKQDDKYVVCDIGRERTRNNKMINL